MLLTKSKLRLLRGVFNGARCTRNQLQYPYNNRGTSICAQAVQTTLPTQSVLESSILPAPFTHPSKFAQPLIADAPLAYDILQGSQVAPMEWSFFIISVIQVSNCKSKGEGDSIPTIVLVHGILGSKKNLRAFANRLLDGHPSWQAILVDLRCHGDSHKRKSKESSSVDVNNVQSAAKDILQLLNYLKIFPRVLIGHSFGGKVIMSMAQQFGKTLPRPVQAWVLDTMPGEVRNDHGLSRDHPLELIKTLQSIPLPIRSRSELIDVLISHGFSQSIASWMTTNLVPYKGMNNNSNNNGFRWNFDLTGIEQLYKSYEMECLWSFLKSPPVGLKLDFVHAERSQFRWGGKEEETVNSYGHKVHLLEDSGHWVHTDNPTGLFQIMKHSFGITEFGLPRSASI
eukprot:g4586.t1